MKKLIFLFMLCSIAANAQINQYTNFTAQDFFKMGGYSYTEQSFPAGVQATPYVRTGPSPQNDFQYAAAATGGIKNLNNAISTVNVGTAITIKMNNNNIRKFAANVLSKTPDGINTTTNVMILSVFTNQGNGQSYIFSNSSITWMGLVATGQNEYIDSVKVSYASASSNVITIGDIMVGDTTPQNVALNFDGVNDNIELPSNVGNFTTNAAFTVTCWVKPASAQVSLANTDNDILEKWDGVAGAYPFVIRYLNSGPDAGKILARRYDGGTLTSTVLISGSSINDGNWHHIAFVREAGGTLKLYIDGSLSNSDPDLSQNSTTNNSPLYIGSRNNVNHFKGEIDEVRIWTVGKTQTEIQNEMFCKNPNTTNLQAAYNFNNGVPNGNNILISQIRDAVGSNHGVFAPVFAKTGDVSNFVTGQVKYVKANAAGLNNGSSWANAFSDLQSALPANTCNDLFDVYVATGTYKPHASDINIYFDIPLGMKIYGGFSGTEKSINERNLALIHSTNKTTLSGDLMGDDIAFNFASNRTDNSRRVVFGSTNNITIDGFTVSGGQFEGIRKINSGYIRISNSKLVDNETGLFLAAGNSTVSNCFVGGNNIHGIYISFNSTDFQNCVVVNNAGTGLYQKSARTKITQSNFTNCTIASNGGQGISNNLFQFEMPIENNIKNTIIKDNAGGGITNNVSGTITNSITYSLVQGVTTGTGNLNGNTVNPQFVSPLANNMISDAGDYRLKWCSLSINAGDNSGISPLDLDRNPRNFNTTADMGAYEFLGNTPSPTNATNSTITGAIDSPTYAGGAIQTITSTAKVIAPAGAIDFKAPNAIILNPGFEARGVGKYFQAQIGANVGCVNP